MSRLKSNDLKSNSLSSSTASSLLDASMFKMIAPDWSPQPGSTSLKQSNVELRPMKGATYASDLAFNIKFERCRMEMPVSIASFLFDVAPQHYDLIEDGSSIPSQAQVFRMLTVGFNLESSYSNIIHGHSIFALPELELRILRTYGRLSTQRRRIANERIGYFVKDASSSVLGMNRQSVLPTIMSDIISIGMRSNAVYC